MLGALALGALSFADGWINAAHAADRAYYGTDTRALEFLVGAVLAVAIAGRTIGRGLSRVFAIAGPFALVALLWANAHAHVGDESLFRGGLLAYAGLGSVLLLAACQPGPVRTLCSSAPLRSLRPQLASRQPLADLPVAVGQRQNRSPPPLGSFTATVAVALVSFHFLEQPSVNAAPSPARRWLRSRPRRPVPSGPPRSSVRSRPRRR